jgi:glycosyltransferase involved in cell wall biosynthesis
MIKLSIGVCTYNRDDIIIKCLDSIVKSISFSNSSSEIEIVVVNNNSTDNTARLLEEFESKCDFSKVFYENKQGLSNARNRLLSESDGEYLLFLDDDVILNIATVDSYLNAIKENSEIKFFGGKVIPDSNVDKPKWFDANFYMAFSILDIGRDTINFPGKLGPIGANLMIKNSTINDIKFRTDLGRVGTSLLSGEETDFLNRTGFNRENALYVGGASVTHCFSESRYSTTWALERYIQNGKSDFQMRQGIKNKLIGFLSQCFHFYKSILTLNSVYIKCRFYSMLSYIKVL